MMPLEIAWASTVQWKAGDIMCRIMMFYAVLKPLHLAAIDRREKMMLMSAWIGAVLCSVPQMIVFHVERHPNITWYYQCVTYNVFPSYAHELVYTVFGMVMMYAFPLLVIIYSYVSIIIEICRRTRNPKNGKLFFLLEILYRVQLQIQ
nr:unnamed protein product [Callosobruchus analis]